MILKFASFIRDCNYIVIIVIPFIILSIYEGFPLHEKGFNLIQLGLLLLRVPGLRGKVNNVIIIKLTIN